jgi:enolase-phosphatase E1
MAQLENKVVSCKAVLLDIEGTTTPISFVKNVLFPYAVNNVKSYLDTHWNETDCLNVIKQLREQVDIFVI